MLANEQHYEVPDEFYYAVLGPYLKYSSGFWKDENTTLAESEIYMLDMYIERAGVDDIDHLDKHFLLLLLLSVSVTYE
jgi:cyclopropane-fatty-acyl-phospholipid synthase